MKDTHQTTVERDSSKTSIDLATSDAVGLHQDLRSWNLCGGFLETITLAVRCDDLWYSFSTWWMFVCTYKHIRTNEYKKKCIYTYISARSSKDLWHFFSIFDAFSFHNNCLVFLFHNSLCSSRPTLHLCPALHICPASHFCTTLHFCPVLHLCPALHICPSSFFGPVQHFCPTLHICTALHFCSAIGWGKSASDTLAPPGYSQRHVLNAWRMTLCPLYMFSPIRKRESNYI